MNCVYKDPFMKTVLDNQGLRFLHAMCVCHFKELTLGILGYVSDRTVHGSQLSRKGGSLNVCGPPWPVTGIALPSPYCAYCYEYKVMLFCTFSFLCERLSFQNPGICSERVQR
jgi:hypothetical protein